jgi:predicted transposase/invertase (TIGR01784 family)
MSNKKIFVPDLLPPSDDGVFKSLLTHPDAKPVLRDVIGSVLRIPVTDVEVRNAELPISDASEKRERFDVNCKTAGGEQIDVEMQARAMDGDSAATRHENLKRRAIYYLCDLHSSQAGRGTAYGDLMSSYQITFCKFTAFPKRKGFLSRFAFRDEEGFLLSDAVGIAFVELSKLRAAMAKPVREMTSAEMWGIFFGHAGNPKRKDLLREMIEAKEEIKMANEILLNISKDEIERAHYRSRRMFLTDMQHSHSVARKEGFDEGVAKMAKNALAMHLPMEQIQKLTGLSRAEIERLR